MKAARVGYFVGKYAARIIICGAAGFIFSYIAMMYVYNRQTVSYGCGYLAGQRSIAERIGYNNIPSEIPSFCGSYRDTAVKLGFNP